MISGPLKVVVNQGSLAKAEMEDLRKAMPSISHVLRKLHTIPDNNKLITLLQFWLAITRIPEFKTLLHFRISCYKLTSFNTGDQLERLLILESEFGTLPGFTPALDVVIEFLTTLQDTIKPVDIPMRNLLYSMLSTEGTYKSQKEEFIHLLDLVHVSPSQLEVVLQAIYWQWQKVEWK